MYDVQKTEGGAQMHYTAKVNQVVVLAQILLERIDCLTDEEDGGGAYKLIEHLEAYLTRTESSIDSND